MTGRPVAADPATDDIRFSVVTISYNDEDGLRRTMASTAAQDYPHLEHIVIDGGTGESVRTLLQNSGVRVWRSEPDGGRYAAMNTGAGLATGDVVWFLHSSDIFSHPSALSEVAAELGSAREARSLWGFGSARLVPPHSGNDVWRTTAFDLTSFAFGTRPIPHQAAFFGRDVFDAVGPYDVDFGMAADQLLMLAAALRVSPTTLDRVLCDFDTTGVGTVRSQREHYADVRRMWDVVDWYPVAGRAVSRFLSRFVEWQARGKRSARAIIAPAPAHSAPATSGV